MSRGSAVAAAALVAALAAGCTPCDEETGTLCRIVGTGKSGFNGDGHAPRDTDFYAITAARRGPDGLLYVMDYNNHRLRRVTADDKVETVVGTGEHAYAIAGKPGPESPLENPVDFAFSPDGTLHLVMMHDPRVLKLVDGKVEIAAGVASLGDEGDGGPALQARFSQLAGIIFGADGSMFLADEVAHRVRVVRPDGTVHAVAGTGAPGYSGDGRAATQARLDSPRGLALDANGNLFVADAGNDVIRRVGTDGVITTVAGTGAAGYSGDGGEATAAQLRHPEGVAIGPDGALYIADTDNHRVRRVANGIIETVAGNGERGTGGENDDAKSAQLSAPYAVAFDDDGDLLISETRTGTLSVVYR